MESIVTTQSENGHNSEDGAGSQQQTYILAMMHENSTDTESGIDHILSRTYRLTVPPETRKQIRDETRKLIKKLRLQDSRKPIQGRKERRRELEMRRNLDAKAIHIFMKHPYFVKMMRTVVEEMISNEHLWRRYKPTKLYRDTSTSKRRIQPELSAYFIEYALKYGKRPWRYPGKNQIKTKLYETLDWVANPFDIIEEETQEAVAHGSVKV